MTVYRVEWTIDVPANNPREAAENAFAHMRRPDTTATCFSVTEHDGDGQSVPVDLMDPGSPYTDKPIEEDSA